MVTIATAVASPIKNQILLLMPHSGLKQSDLNCLSWRLAVETDNLKEWYQIPESCRDYVKNYTLGNQYCEDCDVVTAEAYKAKPYNATLFNEWLEEAAAPAIPGSLQLYEQLIELGFKIVFLTGTREAYTESRIKNLKEAGYTEREKLILKGDNYTGNALDYKSSSRKVLEEGGYRIRGNVGDQWSDLTGSNTGDRTFKLPDPMYYVG
ncbi:hypothetical protein L1987_55617 [Smallanthus sonchifolius]|uniref:Uncharacterized protein n=1 Tax=Smallanthus sonchifolius TaxID=185202 RepID=A0ACB9EAV6_9ASTR|nr:hypothetical protein L1987_55617 [Smallanthus sonchifolius]